MSKKTDWWGVKKAHMKIRKLEKKLNKKLKEKVVKDLTKKKQGE